MCFKCSRLITDIISLKKVVQEHLVVTDTFRLFEVMLNKQYFLSC